MMAPSGQPVVVDTGVVSIIFLMLNCPLASHDRDFSGILDLQVIRST